MTSLERTLATVKGKPCDRLPAQPMLITFAARHAGIPFGECCKDGEKLAAAQLQTMRDFDLDILLTCSDPAREVIDMAGEESVQWYPDQPPAIDESNAALKRPQPSERGRMHDRIRSIEAMRREAGPGAVVVGWVEGALALSAELRGINRIMTDMVDDPDFVEELMDLCADVATAYAEVQVAAGADSIGMSDAAASLMGPPYYRDLLWPRQLRILDSIREMGSMTRLHMCGRTDDLLENMAQLPVDIYELDFLTDLQRARDVLGPDRCICGNIPTLSVLVEGSADDTYRSAAESHRVCGRRHIVSPGCDASPLTPSENIHAMVRYAKEATP
jgi:MtaA/CmuA family methyltransferase